MADHDEQGPWLEGEPAFLLDEGIAYVRAWGDRPHTPTEPVAGSCRNATVAAALII